MTTLKVGSIEHPDDSANPVTIGGTGGIILPSGTTNERPSNTNGLLRFNSTANQVEYYHPTAGWNNVFNDPATYAAQILVIGGGGAGGYTTQGWAGGGGGSGGIAYHDSASLTDGAEYTVTVGSGATGPTTSDEHGADNVADNGGDSSVSGDNVSMTAYGGGGGAGYRNAYTNGADGGSGGGAEGNSTESASVATQGTGGTTHYGNAGSVGTQGSPYIAGGGGGAGAAGTVSGGGSGTSDFSAWGAATSTGHNVSGTYYFAGGGGGGAYSGTPGTGGNGGGGAGGNTSGSSGGDATDFTGSGGGGRGAYNNGSGRGGNGGDGIVIIRYADGGAQLGSGGTVTQSGGYYYHVFTASGTYTA